MWKPHKLQTTLIQLALHRHKRDQSLQRVSSKALYSTLLWMHQLFHPVLLPCLVTTYTCHKNHQHLIPAVETDWSGDKSTRFLKLNMDLIWSACCSYQKICISANCKAGEVPTFHYNFKLFLLLSLWFAADLTHLPGLVGARLSLLQLSAPKTMLSRLFVISQPTQSTWKVNCRQMLLWYTVLAGEPSCRFSPIRRHGVIHCNLAVSEQKHRPKRLCGCFPALPVVIFLN